MRGSSEGKEDNDDDSSSDDSSLDFGSSDDDASKTKSSSPNNKTKPNKRPSSSSSQDDKQEATSSPPAAKRIKLDSSEDAAAAAAAAVVVDPELVQHAKQRLSKWAARLFDPDRPRGLVEAPKTIPLNDEFLTAFGKREAQYNQEMGVELEVNTLIESDDDDEEDGDEDDDSTSSKGEAGEGGDSNLKTPKKKSHKGFKVKVSNLAYRTSAAKLQQACETYGPIRKINMILDQKSVANQASGTIQNSGRAYVTFDLEDSALACIDGLREVDGRTLRLVMASEAPSNKPKTPASSLARYWEEDISTVCFRCGKVGHMEASCPNPAKPRPCHLCAKTDHDARACQLNRICFNCGVPGHINRECRQPRGMPKRLVCGICFRSGHHRLQCRERATDVHTNDAICMICHKTGHFMCREMQWFYGLNGVSCFNCGQQGHNGYSCNRPNLDQCNRDPELTNNEIERAGAMPTDEESSRGRGRQQQADNQRGSRGGGNRHRSLPPQGSRRGGGNSGGRGDPRRQSGGGRGPGRGGRGPDNRQRGYRV